MSLALATSSSEKVTVRGLTDDEQDLLSALLAQLRAKRPRNLIRSAYYDGKNAISSVGLTIPQSFARFALVLGWSAKAVDQLVDRVNLEGFVVPGLDLDQYGMSEIWDENRLDAESPQAHLSSLIHATGFLVTTEGDVDAGEPEALITAKDALAGTGFWDRRRRELTSFLSILDTDDNGRPVEMVLYVPDETISMVYDGRWSVERTPHPWGVPVDPLTYRPRLGRPFGSSRISRAVMSLHDSAVRTALRSEVSAELYSVPQRALLGADERAFMNADGTVKSAWQAIMGLVWAIPDDETATTPRASIEEFSAASQDPHVSQLRAWAQLFAGETSIPISSLGVSGEANPTSAEAYYASREDLIKLAESTIDGFSTGWRRAAVRALRIKNGWADPDSVPPELAKIQPIFRNPATASRAAAADAAMKTLSQFPWLAETDLGLELYGFDRTFIDRAMAERRRLSGSTALARMVETASAPSTSTPAPETGARTDPAEIKAQADAMGILIRAGVEPESAAAQVGLVGVEFTGAVPVSLRLPEAESADLEEK